MAAPGVFQGRGAHGAAVALSNHRPKVDAMRIVDAVQTRNVDGLLLVESAVHVLGDKAEGFGGLRSPLGIRDGFGEDGNVALWRGGYSVRDRRAVSIRAGGEIERRELALWKIIPNLPWRRRGRMLGRGIRGS